MFFPFAIANQYQHLLKGTFHFSKREAREKLWSIVRNYEIDDKFDIEIVTYQYVIFRDRVTSREVGFVKLIEM